MSDDNSESTDSDNNNAGPFYNNYLRRLPPAPPYEHPESPDLEIEISSDSEYDVQLNNLETSSGETDVSLQNTSEESDYPIDESSNSSGSSSALPPYINKIITGNSNVTTPRRSYWYTPKEIYYREIGMYNRAQWGYKFYQSLVSVQKLKLSKQLKGHDGCVNSLDFNRSGDMIVSGSDDVKICLWDWSKGKSILVYISPHTRNIYQTKFLTTQGDIHIVSSGRDGNVILTTMNNSSVINSKIIARHNHSCNKLGIHHDLPYIILSCGEDGIVKNIDIRVSSINATEKFSNILNVRNTQGTTMQLYGIDINPMNSHEFILNGDDEFVRMYDKRRLTTGPLKKFRRQLPSARIINNGDDDNESRYVNILTSRDITVRRPVFPISESNITSAVYNYCGTEILASYSEDDIYLFDVNGLPFTSLHHYSGHLNRMTIKGVNFYGPRSEYVISGSDCGHIFFWDKKSEAIVQRKHADVKGAVNVLKGHPHIPTLATSGLDKTIKIWEPLNKWRQPNKNKLRMSVVKNRVERDRTARLAARQEEHNIMGHSLPYSLQLPGFF